MPAISAQKTKKKAVEPRRQGAGTVWRRVTDNWEALEALGANQDLGTVVGRLFLFGELSQSEASAARLYAEVYGRYSRYHNLVRETAASPAYERGFGREDEVERHTRTNTLAAYERRAKRAKKAWEKLLKHVPPTPAARDILHEVTILNREINSAAYPDLRAILGNIARAFRLTPPEHYVAPPPPKSDPERRVRLAVGSLGRWFKDNNGEFRTFRLLGDAAPDGTRGIEGYGFTHDDATPLKHAVRVNISGTIKEHIDALFVRVGTSVGLKEVTV